MKTLFLPLLAASSILSVLAPRADAAAITFNTGALQPRMLGPASFNQRNRSGVPGSVFRVPEGKVMSAINDALNVSGGTIKTGAGTLTLDNSGFINGGILTVGGGTLGSGTVNVIGGTLSTGSWTSVGSGTIDTNGVYLRINGGTLLTRDTDPLTAGLSGSIIKTGNGTLTLDVSTGNFGGSILTVGSSLDFGVSQTLGALNISDGAVILLNQVPNPPVAGVLNLWSNSDPAAALAWASGTAQRDWARQNSNGTIQIGARELALNADTTSAAASAPVPEPASAVLLVIGALAVSRSRRRRES